MSRCRTARSSGSANMPVPPPSAPSTPRGASSPPGSSIITPITTPRRCGIPCAVPACRTATPWSFEFIPIYGQRGLRGKEAPAPAGGPCTGLQSCPPAFLALISVTVDELQRLVSPFEAALQAQIACCYALHHFRMHLTLWPLIV